VNLKRVCSRVLCAAGLILSMQGFAVETVAPVQPDKTLDIYATPARLVDIGGRKLNLRCSGTGTQTVMLEAGAIADSMTWFKVQPQLAKTTTVCSYDRAGLGFSDEGPLPRDLDAEAGDLHALIHAAGIKTPVVLVAHSRGTNIARRYADKYRADLAALVLLDPPAQNIAAFAPEFAKADDAGRAQAIAFMRQCAKGAEAGKLGAPTQELQRCLRGPDPALSQALNDAQRANKSRPAFWHTIISTYETNALYDAPVPADEKHGTLPIIVLRPDSTEADAPQEVRKALQAARDKTQQAIVATSTRGKRIDVAHSSHDVQTDRPDAVIAAVNEVVRPSGASASAKH